MNARTLVELFREVGFTYEHPGFLLDQVDEDLQVTVGEEGGGGCSLESPADAPVSVQWVTGEGEYVGGQDFPDGRSALTAIRGRI